MDTASLFDIRDVKINSKSKRVKPRSKASLHLKRLSTRKEAFFLEVHQGTNDSWNYECGGGDHLHSGEFDHRPWPRGRGSKSGLLHLNEIEKKLKTACITPYTRLHALHASQDRRRIASAGGTKKGSDTLDPSNPVTLRTARADGALWQKIRAGALLVDDITK
ncbi:hypothetical protein EVAR_3069_1 [Eumeta japonica]|uniref:Uncharacterized protein n=1 Tax=Eumeta variegata TaxID=151549 RepID=A0A4C1STX7_EUMVA|nr:hypothetical protein EVAR_3069_1 [Eumeta japonica]